MKIRAKRDSMGIVRKAGPNGLRVVSGTASWPVRRMWNGGFSLSAGARIRGHVEIHDGDVFLFSCLAYAVAVEQGEQVFHIKDQTPFLAAAPMDFAHDGALPGCALAAFEASRVGL